MKTLKALCFAAVMVASEAAFAGGLINHVNQNVAFLRNPASDATIGLNGVYTNPAGVVFMDEGFHLSVNIQSAYQNRTIDTEYAPFAFNANDPGTKHHFNGKANAPVIPSIQAALNKGKWSFQFNFAITGGGGKCTFEDGLGSFESVVAGALGYRDLVNQQLYGGLQKAHNLLGSNPVMPMPGSLNPIPDMGGHEMGTHYAFDSYMRGRQYYYGFTLGAARKINEHLSVYGGLRMIYATSNYYGYVKDIQIEHIQNGKSEMVNASKHFANLREDVLRYAGAMDGIADAAGVMAGAAAATGNAVGAATYQAMQGQLKDGSKQMDQAAAALAGLSTGLMDIELNCDQTGWGVAPIIGIDYKTSWVNLAAKYEFKTRLRLKNKAANSLSAKAIKTLDKFADGKKVAEDSPALLTMGAQFNVLPTLRLSLGWHHFFDTDTPQHYAADQGDTNEYLFGAEYDICPRLTVSAGAERTVFGNHDSGMSDISFNVNSYSYGLGLAYKIRHNMTLNLAYYQSIYDDYTKHDATLGKTDTFTRDNKVFGIGLDMKF